MMLGRLAAASRFAVARQRVPSAAVGFASTARGFAAAAVNSPKPLSMRADSLMFKCVVAALIYFVPQDVVFLGGVLTAWHNKAASISPCKKQADAEAAVEAFKEKKGLSDVGVSKGRTWHVSLK
eukprot:TRINITY_DN3055_c0_g2_i2.p1 TRINITY_DN3055_c0_g2~~TRINITY_DN3055_c0_g2_i2.p1  ORF type:complete len:124 (-),score=37.86 TRINITY_DN3055_c0_g2_i2:234-605(-)